MGAHNGWSQYQAFHNDVSWQPWERGWLSPLDAKETEAQRGEVSYPKSHSSPWQSWEK